MTDQHLTWLHFSDFHYGVQGQQFSWDTVKDNLFKDIKRLYSYTKGQGWDFVFFTGDLTQEANREQFNRLTTIMEELWSEFKKYGCDPVLLAIPGNHDLVRPKKTAKPDPKFDVLQSPKNTWATIAAKFWGEKRNVYRDYVNQCFANFQNWLKDWYTSHPLPSWVTFKNASSLIGGDFCATAIVKGMNIRIIGLNSAFLQLTGNYYKGELELSAEQIKAVCCTTCYKDFDANLLMTHHPPDWLSENGQKNYYAHVIGEGFFSAHLYGHMHEPITHQQSTAGGHVRFRIQAASLFSEDTYGKEEVTQRIRGYNMGQLHFNGDEGTIKLWPRLLIEKKDGSWRMEPDVINFSLAADNSIETPHSFRRTGTSHISKTLLLPSSSSEITVPAQVIVIPRRSVYVSRPKEELNLLRYLQKEFGKPVIVWGSAGSGKTLFLHHVIDRLHAWEQDTGSPGHFVEFTITPPLLNNIETFCKSLLEHIMRALDVPKHLRQRGGETPLELIMHDILEQVVQNRLVLALRNGHFLLRNPVGEMIFAMFAAWAQQMQHPGKQEPSWRRLRLVILISAMETLTTGQSGSSFLSTAQTISLREYDPPQVAEMIRSYGLPWKEPEIEALMRLAGGHHRMLSMILEAAADEGESASVPTLERARELCQFHLNSVLNWIKNSPGLVEAIQQIVANPQTRLPGHLEQQLINMGLLAKQSQGQLTIRPALYENYLT